MAYSAKILADSVSPDLTRLTTMLCEFPRFILAEINTHRVFSRNSASSRAIPPERQIERVRTDPFVPETFNKRVKGMGVGEALEKDDQELAREIWLDAAEAAAHRAGMLARLDADKSRINRLLEPYLWHQAIISSTEWDNFFALRCPPGDEPDINFPAQLEFQRLAIEMREAMRASTPRQVESTEWHLPMLTDEEIARHISYRDPDILHPSLFDEYTETFKLVSAGRLARVSFDTHEKTEPWEDSIARARRLMESGHLSPFEHVARPLGYGGPDEDCLPNNAMGIEPYTGYANYDWGNLFVGNFRGWVQMRREIPNEACFVQPAIEDAS